MIRGSLLFSFCLANAVCCLVMASSAGVSNAQDILPFPPTPSASQAGVTIPSSTYQKTSGGNDHYHLSEDLADDAIVWLREQKAYAPDKPFFMYWAPGASHGPHQVMKDWADKIRA